jgi:virulence-associated protein VapD
MGQMILWGYSNITSVSNLFEYKSVDYELDYYKQATSKSLQVSESMDIKELTNQLESIEEIVQNIQLLLLNGEQDIYSVGNSVIHNKRLRLIYDNEALFDQLKSEISNYRNYAISICGEDKYLQKLISGKLSTEKTEFKNMMPVSWEMKNLYSKSLITFTYSNLHRILKDVYQIQYEVINHHIKEAPEL